MKYLTTIALALVCWFLFSACDALATMDKHAPSILAAQADIDSHVAQIDADGIRTPEELKELRELEDEFYGLAGGGIIDMTTAQVGGAGAGGITATAALMYLLNKRKRNGNGTA